VEYAVAFQEMAKPAGINVKIEQVPPDGYWSETWMKVPLCMSNWSLRVTADETLTTAYHSEAKWNESDYRNPDLDRIIDQARGEKDSEIRRALYAQAQQMLRDEGGVVISYFKPTVMAMRKEVQNYHPHPIGWFNPHGIWLAATG
jgi:peptide/nickel transport system substrate-binding protein